MSRADFDLLARGGGGANVVRQLRRAQLSRRLHLLRAFIFDVTADPKLWGDLPEPDEAWDLLARVQDVAPDAYRSILLHPYTGAWLSHVLKVIHGEVEDDRPVWAHVGHFHSLAAAAAIRAGINFETRVPLGGGGVALPTLGMARFTMAEPWAVAEIRAKDERVEISTATGHVTLPRNAMADTSGWWGLRTLTAHNGGHRLSIRLDDLDPYRGQDRLLAPRRIDADEVKAWDELLQEAWQLIVQHLPDYADGLPDGLESIVPYPVAAFRNQSGSTSETFGSAIMERPPDAVALAATLVHEYQHIRLYGLTNLFELHADDRSQRFYTLWRDDPRPVGGTLHGIYSFLGVTEFWRAVAATTGDHRAWFEFAYWRAGTWRTLQGLLGDHSLTAAGHRFVESIAGKLEPWQHEPVPGEPAELAAAAGTDHVAGWRLRHVSPPGDLVHEVADRWIGERDSPGDRRYAADQRPTVEPDGSWPGARTDLIRLSLTGPGSRDIAEIRSIVADATDADIAYASGDFAEAARRYQADLAGDPNPASGWVGLGLALSASGDRAAAPLLDRPELVRAVYREILDRTATAADLDEYLAWWSRPAAESLQR
jgi:HEXXH motif-containing protein